MSARQGGDFEGGPQKAYIRQHWDLPVLRELRNKKGRPLRYFGMPGPAIEDVRDWSKELGFVTAIDLLRSGSHEEGDRERLRRLKHSLMEQGIAYQVLRGFVEDVILRGYDIDGQQPVHRNERDPTGILRFCYDIVNLDFLGGAGYRSKAVTGQPKRLTAIKELFRRQRGTEFVFLLTLNVRNTIDTAACEHLKQWRTRVDPTLQSAIDWYVWVNAGKTKYRLKAAILAFVQRMAEDEGFVVRCYPPVAYVGTANATMVHFVFRCEPTLDPFHSISSQSDDDLVRLPLLCFESGVIQPELEQHTAFDWKHCHRAVADAPNGFGPSLQSFIEERFTVTP